MSFYKPLLSSVALHGLLFGALIFFVGRVAYLPVPAFSGAPVWATLTAPPLEITRPELVEAGSLRGISRAKNPPLSPFHTGGGSRRSQQLVSSALHLAKNMQEPSVGGASFHIRKRVLGEGRATGEDALYLDSWKRKIEAVGSLNYPSEARRLGLSGRLSVRVLINRDGSVREATLLGSSGKPILDQAALRIVHLAGPFSPLPPTMRRSVDVLEIVRTWHFLDARELVM